MLANVVNNLPATLALIPLVAGQPALVLAMLHRRQRRPERDLRRVAGHPALAAAATRATPSREAGEFHLLGILTVPVILVLTHASRCGAADQLLGLRELRVVEQAQRREPSAR